MGFPTYKKCALSYNKAITGNHMSQTVQESKVSQPFHIPEPLFQQQHTICGPPVYMKYGNVPVKS